jgi:magnesium-transporting ATPase (P-type)
MPPSEIISLVLTAVLAPIPVALPATFTLAAAVGAWALGRLGILPTRRSAVDEAASIDVLCADKTGTLTANELRVTTVRRLSGFDEAHVLGFAALGARMAARTPLMPPFARPPRSTSPPICRGGRRSCRSIRRRRCRRRPPWIRAGAICGS